VEPDRRSRRADRRAEAGRPELIHRPREFLSALPELVRPKLPPELGGFSAQQRFALVQLWFESRRVHYEVWFHRRIDRLEVGLHFEADPATNQHLLEHFDANLIVAKAEISERVEAEPWDRGWARVYEMLPLEPLDERYMHRVAEKLARFIVVLEPLREDAKPWPTGSR
jgi:hypothetical protein